MLDYLTVVTQKEKNSKSHKNSKVLCMFCMRPQGQTYQVPRTCLK